MITAARREESALSYARRVAPRRGAPWPPLSGSLLYEKGSRKCSGRIEKDSGETGRSTEAKDGLLCGGLLHGGGHERMEHEDGAGLKPSHGERNLGGVGPDLVVHGTG